MAMGFEETNNSLSYWIRTFKHSYFQMSYINSPPFDSENLSFLLPTIYPPSQILRFALIPGFWT